MVSTSYVYALRLKTGKHFYIGSTNNLFKRLACHAETSVLEEGSSYPTKTYGFSGNMEDVLYLQPFATYPEAVRHEKKLARMWSALFEDTAVFGGGINMGREHKYNIPAFYPSV